MDGATRHTQPKRGSQAPRSLFARTRMDFAPPRMTNVAAHHQQRCLSDRLNGLLEMENMARFTLKVVEFYALILGLLAFVEPSSGQASLSPRQWTLNFTQSYCTLARPSVCKQPPELLNHFPQLQPVCSLVTQDEIENKIEQNKCNREPTGWRWFYTAELDPPFSRLIKESSLEERLANIIHLSTIAKAFKNDINFYKFNAQNVSQNIINQQLVCGKRVDDALCLRHLQHMTDTMRELQQRLLSHRRHNQSKPSLDDKHVHLARVLDSFGRYSSGHLSGRLHIFGAHDQCIKSQLLLDHGHKVSTRYCVANLNLTGHLSRSLGERKRYPHETGDAMLHVGICVPESCHSKSFAQKESQSLIKWIVDSQFSLPQTMYEKSKLDLDSVFCLVDEDSEYNRLSTGGLVFVGAMVIWLSAICYHSLRAQGPASPDCLVNHAMNVCGSFRKLFHGSSTSGDTNAVDLEALYSSQVMAQITIIMLHAGAFMAGFTNDALSCVILPEQDSFLSALLMFTSMVDTSFALNGLIHTYNTLKHLAATPHNRNTVSCFLRHWFKWALGRYLRLAPMLFLVFAFKKTLFVHLNNGPMWDQGLNQDTSMGYCLQKQSWLSVFDLSLLKIEIPFNCVTVSWSIVNEIIFALILPPLVHLIHWKQKQGALLVGASILISTISCYRAFEGAEPAAIFELRDLRPYGSAVLSTVFHHLYVNPFFRLASYLVGVLAGWYLFWKESQLAKVGATDPEGVSNDKGPSIRWPWWFERLATPASILVHLANIVVSCKVASLRTSFSPYHRNFMPNMFSTNRLIFSLAYVVLFLRISTDWRKSSWFVRNIVKGKLWAVLSKLNYMLLLVHWDVMTYDLAIRTQEVFCSRWMIWSLFASAYLASLALSALLYLLVQNPLNCLIRTFVLNQI